MRSYALAALPVAAQALSAANHLAVVDDNRAVELPGLLRFPIEATKIPDHGKNQRRQVSGDVTFSNKAYLYLINLTIGTPGQEVTVSFNTGADELWVNPDCPTAGNPEFCDSLGRYNNSTTFEDLNAKNSIQYDEGSVEFQYVRDFVSVGSAKIEKQIFGVNVASKGFSTGVLGVGPPLKGFDTSPYSTVIDSLAKQGLTNSRTFSVDLRPANSARGAVIFGGADTKKFTGKLTKSPIISGPDGAARYWVALNGLDINMVDGSKRTVITQGSELPVYINTGSTLSFFPKSVVDHAAEAFPGAVWVPKAGVYQVSCTYRSQDKTVDFLIGGTTVKVPYADFIWESAPNACVMGLVPSADEKTFDLGINFLHAAYVVFDQDNKNLWFAQSADCGTNLVAFGSGADAVTALEGGCAPPVTTSTTTTTTATSTTTSSVPTTTDSTTSTETSSVPTTTDTTTSTDATTTGSETSSSVPTTSDATTSTDSTTSTDATTSTGVTSSSETSSSVPTGTDSTTSGVPTSTGVTTGAPTSTGVTTGAPTSTGTTSMPWTNMTTTALPTYTSTYVTTTTYTITSCLPTVTNCPVGHVTTETLTSYTTWCPGEATGTNTPAQPTGQPGSQCPGPNCNKPAPGGDKPAPGGDKPAPGGDKPAPGGDKPAPGGDKPGSQCPGPNCEKPAPGGDKPAPGGDKPAPGGDKPSSPGGGHQCPGGANCPHPTGMATASKACATCGTGPAPTGKTPVTAGASEMFRVSGAAAVVAAMAALIL